MNIKFYITLIISAILFSAIYGTTLSYFQIENNEKRFAILTCMAAAYSPVECSSSLK